MGEQERPPPHAASAPRYCPCGTRLSVSNPGWRCGLCERKNRESLGRPPVLDREVWDGEHLSAALATRDMGAVFRAYRCAPCHRAQFGPQGITQAQLAGWLGINQAQVSRIECGTSATDHLNTLIRWAQILHIPSDKLWFDLPDTASEHSDDDPAPQDLRQGHLSIMTENSEPAWAQRIKQQRETRGWTQTHTVQKMRSVSASPLPDSLLDMWKRWERGKHEPDQFHKKIIAATFGTSVESLFDGTRSHTAENVDRRTDAAVHLNDTNGLSGNDLSVSLLAASLAVFTAMAGSIMERRGPGEQLTILCRLVDEMKRRGLLQLLGWTSSTVFSSPLLEGLDFDDQERLAGAIVRPERVDAQVITHIETILSNALLNNDRLGPQSALHTVLAQHEILQAMAADCPSELRPRLLSVRCNSLRIAGWISFNADDLPGTRRYYEQARTLAHDAQDLELAAMVLANLSHAAESSAHPTLAVDYATAAQTWAARAHNAHLSAFTSDIGACAYAAIGDYDETMRNLDNTHTYLSGCSDPSSSTFYSYREALHTARRGHCLSKLGHTSDAIQVIEKSLNLYSQDNSDYPYGHNTNVAVGKLELSEAHVSAGDVDEASTTLTSVVDFISQNRADRLVKRVRNIRTSLQPWNDTPAVKQLDEQLQATGLRS